MKGYSFRSLTDLVLKIFKTKVNAGTGLSGGGSLEADRTLTVKYGTAAGTAAQGNDSRLSNSREWTAATISQAETEAGTATTRRAFTAQRVRQAIVAWFNGISGALGRTILSRTTSAQVRSDIGLGTAATKDITTSSNDTTSGRVMKVADFGLGNDGRSAISRYPDVDSIPQSGFYQLGGNSGPLYPAGGSSATVIQSNWDRDPTVKTQILHTLNNRVFVNSSYTSGGFKELIHTGNILQETGTSSDFPMSQAATTIQLATKASNSTQVIAGTGLTGGGTIAANRSLSVNYGTTAGTAVQGNDSRVVNALQRGNNLNDITNKTSARSNLGLGSAATYNVGTSAGTVMEVGAFGLGASEGVPVIDSGSADDVKTTGFYRLSGSVTDAPSTDGLLKVYSTSAATMVQEFTGMLGNKPSFYRVYTNGVWTPWRELFHTGNILTTTGQSTQYPMSQAAITSQLATKTNTSTQVIAGTGLSGGGTLATNCTLSVNYGTTAGSSVQGNDSRVVNALQRGNNFSDVPNKTTARSNLGLGTAATRDVGEGSGQLMEVGVFGLGQRTLDTVSSAELNGKGLISVRLDSSDPLNPTGSGVGAIHTGLSSNFGAGIFFTASSSPAAYVYSVRSDNPYGPYELLSTGNILQATGRSTEYPMSQKAVTDAINSSSLGVGQTWQDVSGSRVAGTTYTNTTGRSILIMIMFEDSRNGTGSVIVDGVAIVDRWSVGTDSIRLIDARSTTSFVVPPGSTYIVDVDQYATIHQWSELR